MFVGQHGMQCLIRWNGASESGMGMSRALFGKVMVPRSL